MTWLAYGDQTANAFRLRLSADRRRLRLFPQCITTTSLPAGATTSSLIFNGDGVLEGHPRMTIGSVFRHLSSNDHSAFPPIPCAYRRCTATSTFHERPQDWHSFASSLHNFRAYFRHRHLSPVLPSPFSVNFSTRIVQNSTSARARFCRVPRRLGDLLPPHC